MYGCASWSLKDKKLKNKSLKGLSYGQWRSLVETRRAFTTPFPLFYILIDI